VFVVFPQAINMLPAFNSLIAILFFGTLLMLAIDSAFSLLEAVATTFRDRYESTSTKKIAFLLSLVGIVAGLIFATKAGLYFLDIVDHFVVNYGLVIVGFLEALIVGWLWKGNDFMKFINENSEWKIGKWWSISIKYIIPLFLGVLLIWNVVNEFKVPYEGYPAWALLYIGVLPIVLAPFIGMMLDKLTRGSRN